jgi:toxin FitB
MIILDTNVISELMKPQPDKRVLQWLDSQLNTTLFTTTITQAEIGFGLHLLPEGRRKADLCLATEQLFKIDFSGRVLSFDSLAAQAFAKIAAATRQQGRTMGSLDAQIAAITHSHQAALATRNSADFQACQLKLINPWENYQ